MVSYAVRWALYSGQGAITRFSIVMPMAEKASDGENIKGGSCLE